MAASVIISQIPVQDLTYDEALEKIDSIITKREPGRMVVTNASKTVLAQSDTELLAIIQSSAIVTADGMSVVWAAKLLGSKLRERVTGIDMMSKLIERASQRGFSVYFLGANQEVVEAVVKHYLNYWPALNVVGYHHGYFDKASDLMAEKIAQTRPDVLFVAMGSPAQEKWINQHQSATGAMFCLGVGGSFDHVAGVSKRAPVWMQKIGCEWLFRLASEPRRLWKRYLYGNSYFIWLVLQQRFGHR